LAEPTDVQRLRGALAEVTAQLARWGWGDMHYGSQPQDPAVIAAMHHGLRVLRETSHLTPEGFEA